MRSVVEHRYIGRRNSGVNGSVTFGDGLTQRGRYPRDGSHPVGSRGEDPIRGLVDEPPHDDIYFGNGCKTDILRMHAAVLSAVQLTIHIGGW